jgi:hypothetical protein
LQLDQIASRHTAWRLGLEPAPDRHCQAELLLAKSHLTLFLHAIPARNRHFETGSSRFLMLRLKKATKAIK